MAFVEIYCDLIDNDFIITRQSFHQIWIVSKKLLVKEAPDLDICFHCSGSFMSNIWHHPIQTNDLVMFTPVAPFTNMV